METSDPLQPDPRVGACVYLLHGLLQRMDQQQPGLIAGMIEGVRHDHDAIDPSSSVEASHGRQIAEEALRMLELMHTQLQMRAGVEPLS